MHQLFLIVAVPAFFALIWYRHWKRNWLTREICQQIKEVAKEIEPIDVHRLWEIAGETSRHNLSHLKTILSEKTEA